LVEEYTFSSEAVARACASELRRQIRRRDLDYSVTRRGNTLFLRDHAFWDGVEDELAELLTALVGRTHVCDGEGRPPAEAA
jgi:hypothetical protein